MERLQSNLVGTSQHPLLHCFFNGSGRLVIYVHSDALTNSLSECISVKYLLWSILNLYHLRCNLCFHRVVLVSACGLILLCSQVPLVFLSLSPRVPTGHPVRGRSHVRLVEHHVNLAEVLLPSTIIEYLPVLHTRDVLLQ